MINRYFNQIANVVSSQDPANPPFQLMVNGSRPPNVTIQIGNEYVYETEAQHLNNVTALLSEYAELAATFDSDSDSVPEIAGDFLIRLKNRYNAGHITLNTMEAVAKQVYYPSMCAEVVTHMAARGKTMPDKTLLEAAMSLTKNHGIKFELLHQCLP